MIKGESSENSTQERFPRNYDPAAHLVNFDFDEDDYFD